MVPCTWAGKLVTVLLSLTGVPLTIFCLGRLGHHLRVALDNLWQSVKCKARILPSRTDVPPFPSLSQTGGSRRRMLVQLREVSEDRLPLSVGIAMTVLWVLLSSLYFQLAMHEPGTEPPGWDYFDALYFTVVRPPLYLIVPSFLRERTVGQISLFTIGFGDYAPNRRSLSFVTFSFIFVGLSLVSMCVSITQRKLESQFDKIVQLLQSMQVPVHCPPMALRTMGDVGLSDRRGSWCCRRRTWRRRTRSWASCRAATRRRWPGRSAPSPSAPSFTSGWPRPYGSTRHKSPPWPTSAGPPRGAGAGRGGQRGGWVQSRRLQDVRQHPEHALRLFPYALLPPPNALAAL